MGLPRPWSPAGATRRKLKWWSRDPWLVTSSARPRSSSSPRTCVSNTHPSPSVTRWQFPDCEFYDEVKYPVFRWSARSRAPGVWRPRVRATVAARWWSMKGKTSGLWWGPPASGWAPARGPTPPCSPGSHSSSILYTLAWSRVHSRKYCHIKLLLP